jgi:hypothetical protein
MDNKLAIVPYIDNKYHNIIPYNTICSICLDYITNDYKKTNCNHIFHNQCLDKWFEHNNTCPLCRQCILLYNNNLEPTSLSSSLSSSSSYVFGEAFNFLLLYGGMASLSYAN